MAAKTRFLNPETLTKPPAYSQVVEVTTPGRLVFISGQIGVGRDGRLVPEISARRRCRLSKT